MFFKDKKIVVTGGAGFVGSNLIKLLLNKTNKKIISLDNYSSGNKRRWARDTFIFFLTTGKYLNDLASDEKAKASLLL